MLVMSVLTLSNEEMIREGNHVMVVKVGSYAGTFQVELVVSHYACAGNSLVGRSCV